MFRGGQRMPISGSATTLRLSVDKSEDDEDTGRRIRAGRAKLIEELTSRRVIASGSDGWKHYIDANWKTGALMLMRDSGAPALLTQPIRPVERTNPYSKMFKVSDWPDEFLKDFDRQTVVSATNAVL